MVSDSNFNETVSRLNKSAHGSSGAIRESQRVSKRDFLRAKHRSLSREAQQRVSVLIVDQSIIVREGLAHMLAGSRFRVVGSYVDLATTSERGGDAKPHIALIDLEQNDAAFASLLQRYEDLKIVAMAEQFHTEKLLSIMAAGASGYIIRSEISRAALLTTLDLVLLGAAVIPRFVEGVVPLEGVPCDSWPLESAGYAAPTRAARLSDREETILGLLTRGDSNKHIALKLDIAEATVKVHVKSLLRKLGVVNRTQAAMWAMARVQPESLQPAE